MIYYQQEIAKIKARVYPPEEQCRQIVQAKRVMDLHFAQALRLEDLAGSAFFSKFHFLRLFKSLYGRTPHQLLTDIRVERAKRLLRRPMPVAEVCLAVGFESHSTFTGLFKRKTGLTPALYQQRWTKAQF